jgi:competence protein ComGC
MEELKTRQIEERETLIEMAVYFIIVSLMLSLAGLFFIPWMIGVFT